MGLQDNSLMIELIHAEHRRDLARELERDRLYRRATARDLRRRGGYSRPLCWLGCRLIAWGEWLEARYSAALPGVEQPRSAARQI